MDQTHLHLLITHLPIFGALLGALVLAFGLWKNSSTTITAAYGVLVLAAIGAGVAYLTGEGAAQTVEHLPGVLESRIERHEDFATICPGQPARAGRGGVGRTGDERTASRD